MTGDADELGHDVLYLASDISSDRTGEVMVMDGGSMAPEAGRYSDFSCLELSLFAI